MSKVQKITLVVLLVLAALMLIRFSDFIFIYPKAFEYFFDELGWSTSGARLGAFVVTAVLHSSQGAIVLWLLFGAKKWEALGVLTTILVGQFVLSLVFTPKFGQESGKSLRYWSKPIAGGCIRTYSSAGFDTESGEERKPVDREIARIINLCERGIRPQRIEPVQLKNRALFDPNSGDPIVYFAKVSSTATDIFDNPGFHPTLGIRLTPITPAMAAELIQAVESTTARKAAEATERAARESAQAAEQTRQQERLIAEETAKRRLAYPPNITGFKVSPSGKDCDIPDIPTIDRSTSQILYCVQFERAARNYTFLLRSIANTRRFGESREEIICSGPIKEGWNNTYCTANLPPGKTWNSDTFKLEAVIDGQVVATKTMTIN